MTCGTCGVLKTLLSYTDTVVPTTEPNMPSISMPIPCHLEGWETWVSDKCYMHIKILQQY